MAQPVKAAPEGIARRHAGRRLVADGVEVGDGRQIDVGADRIVARARQRVDALQPCGINHNREGVGAAVAAQFGEEVVAGGQCHGRTHGVGAGVAGRHRRLAVFQRQAGGTGSHNLAAGDGRVDGDVSLCDQGQACTRPGDRVVDKNVAVAASRSLLRRQDGDIAAAEVGRQRGARDVAAARRNGVVVGVDQPGAHAAACSGGGDSGSVSHVDRGGRGFDEAALAVGCAGIDGAANLRRASLHVAQQHHPACVAALRSAGFDLPAGGHVVTGDPDFTPALDDGVGADQAAVVDQRTGQAFS